MPRSIDASSSGVFPSASGYPRPRSPTYDTLAQVMKKVNSELQARGPSNRLDVRSACSASLTHEPGTQPTLAADAG